MKAKEKGVRYIAMNNFCVAADQTEQFEERWRRRRSYLQGVPGFEAFEAGDSVEAFQLEPRQ